MPTPELAESVLVRDVCLPGRRDPADVHIEGGVVRAVRSRISRRSAGEVVAGRGLWLLPGWIDVQVNDIAWLASGSQPVEANAERIREVCAWQAARGVTGLVLATLAAPLDDIESYLRGVAAVRGEPLALADRILLGGLVEGTFMNPEYCGAHNPVWVLPPSLDVLERFLATGGMRLVNVAPEMSDAALDVIRRAVSAGVVVGVGHAKPHAGRVREAVDAGLSYVIHLGNGPTGSSLKCFEDGGLLEEALRSDRITVTAIVDGVHVHRDIIRDWIARKGPAGFVAVSDAGFATEVPAGEFEVFGVRGSASADGGYLRVATDSDGDGDGEATAGANPLSSDVARLFGSAIGMAQVFENLLDLLTVDMTGVWHRLHEARDLGDALAAASRMCSENPARLLGLADRGCIAEGQRGDCLLAEVSGEPGRHRVRLERVFLGGSR